MKKHESQEITQPSDFFGLEILPECTFESEYGKLTLEHVIVPDFSTDEKGGVRLKEEFDNLKSFIEEKEISKKMSIAESIHKNDFSCDVDSSDNLIISNYYSRRSQCFSDFIVLLLANIRARAFELGVDSSTDVCHEFGYDREAKLSSGELHFNDIPIIQPLSCAGGVYAYCLNYVLNPDKFCPPDYQDLKDEIIAEGIPSHNYLSWAFSRACTNNYTISFVSDVHLCLF
jgi:hypothetical protein